jgi:hypothetical protein
MPEDKTKIGEPDRSRVAADLILQILTRRYRCKIT